MRESDKIYSDLSLYGATTTRCQPGSDSDSLDDNYETITNSGKVSHHFSFKAAITSLGSVLQGKLVSSVRERRGQQDSPRPGRLLAVKAVIENTYARTHKRLGRLGRASTRAARLLPTPGQFQTYRDFLSLIY